MLILAGLTVVLVTVASLAWWYLFIKCRVPASFYQEPAQVIENKASQLMSSVPEPVPSELECDEYDVCIMGAGAAGVMQARHLQLECPGLKICMIDPLTEARTEEDDDCHKIGESTVFTSATFLVRDLDLHEYLIMNHYPKHGLFYHWAKDVSQTETLKDYYSAVSLTLPEIPSFQIDRPKFERDLLHMVLKRGGVTYIQGKVTKIAFADEEREGGEPVPTIHGEPASVIEVLSGADKDKRQVRAAHLIDAAGRAFLIGKRKKLITTDANQLMDIQT